MAEARWREGELASPTGATLHTWEIAPQGTPASLVQINHGMAEHGARYERFARFLAGRGHAVIAHDHRGHGATTAPDAPLGMFGSGDGWASVIADTAAVNAHLRAMHPDTPLVVFGHSMGATVALDFALTHPAAVDGVALFNISASAPVLLRVFSVLLGIERMFKGSDTPSGLATAMTFSAWNRRFRPNRTEFDWLSRDEAEVDKYVADPLCGFPVSVGLWRALVAAILSTGDDRRLAALPRNLPFCLVGGGEDPVSDRGREIVALSRRLERAGFSDVTAKVYEATRHETLNEINRDIAMASFADWLDARYA
ncbi:MAG: alpha/beta hydrolase [Pseudomonadota bacterium]|nr:alpha/beta hydrolase [Pseudomonadota bacterium]